MAVQAIDRQTPLNQFLIDDVADTAAALNRKAIFYGIVEKVSQVAILAIIASIYFVSYSSIALTGTLPLVFVGLTFSTIFFVWVMSQFRIYANKYSQSAEFEEKVAAHLEQIKDWGTDRVLQFLRDEGLQPERIPVQMLRRLNEQEPFKALLPLIARYQLFKESAAEMQKEAIDALAFKIEQDIREAEALRGPIDEIQKRTMRLYARDTYYRKYEHEAIPRALEAAYLLQIIQDPTKQDDILSLGEFRSKGFDERMFDRNYQPRNDYFFVFFNAQRNPITLGEIEQDPMPSRLRQRLFA